MVIFLPVGALADDADPDAEPDAEAEAEPDAEPDALDDADPDDAEPEDPEPADDAELAEFDDPDGDDPDDAEPPEPEDPQAATTTAATDTPRMLSAVLRPRRRTPRPIMLTFPLLPSELVTSGLTSWSASRRCRARRAHDIANGGAPSPARRACASPRAARPARIRTERTRASPRGARTRSTGSVGTPTCAAC